MSTNVVLPTVCAILVGTFLLSMTWSALRINRNERRIEAILDELHMRSADRWHKTDHDRWADELRKSNPTLKIPD